MELVYVHHAMRKFSYPRSQEDDITTLGKKEAKIIAKLFSQDKKRKIRAIYTSPFKRCLKTANIINKKLNVPIIHESRLNEVGSVECESWLDAQNRIRVELKDIVNKFNDDDCVICVTSGVNIIAFIQLALKIKPSENAPFIKVPSCSPMMFDIDKSNFSD